MKKLIALVLAAVMMMTVVSAFAAGTGDLNINNQLQVAGLDAGDTVTYYQILKWDPDNSIKGADGNPLGWVWGDGIAKANMSDDDLKAIVGTTDGSGEIKAALAGKIASNLGTAAGSNMPTSGGKWTTDVTKAGLYMVIVTPATVGTIYNPIFVAANYYGGNETPDTSNSIAVSANVASYSDGAMAKKTTIPLDKTATGHGTDGLDDADPYRTDVGEVIDFKVETMIPLYSADYTNPVFKIQDTLTGLELTGDPVVKDSKDATLVKDTDYTLEKTATSYTITFTQNYLKNKNTNTITATGEKITVTYSAEVTDAAEKIINQDKNTVDVIFSTKPTDTTGAGRKRDETNHFTFSIDANLIGQEDIHESSTEAIKVGLDKEGNPILEEKTYETSSQKHSALDGATFKLYKDSDCTQLYTNDVFNGTVVSTGKGRITIKGLDVGTYYLKEESAPDGFIKMQSPVKVVIEAEIQENVKVVTEADGTEVTYYTNELKSYKVTIGGQHTTYTITNSKATTTKTTRDVSSSDSELVNTKGVELPSTGGIGTTLFYAIGGLMVLAAGIVLVSRRKADEE